MKIKTISVASALVCTAAALCCGGALAQESGEAGAAPTVVSGSPLKNGAYIAPVIYYLGTDDKALKGSATGALMFGYRHDFYATEIGAIYADISGARQYGLTVKGLLFPFDRWLPGLFLTAGVGVLQYDHVRGDNGIRFHTYTAEAGAGYLLPLQFGRYDFALRGEAVYRNGRRERYLNGTDTDIPIPTTFNDELIGLGLQLPLGLRPPQPVLQEAPAAVVPVEQPAPPPPAPPPPPPPPPCVTPEAGQPVNLQGCKTGDKIILHGVNFEFNEATLTVNAKTILDQVAGELKKYTNIVIELGGYTDGKGSVPYNLRLSDRRAASVMAYLVQAGIDAKRMASKGYGKADPVADNNTDEGRELNRRVELKITSGVASSSIGTTDAGTATAAVAPVDNSVPASPAAPAAAAEAPPGPPPAQP